MSDLDITATTDGPFHVRGPVRLQRKDGSLIATVATEAWLCRCGESRTKPFCDDSHRQCGFRDAAAHPWTGRTAEEPGAPAITVRRNGPYFVEGRVTICDAAGQVLADGSRIVLCRCGASRRKPFCDATHRETGFEAD